jgi:hypothetical protein
MSSAFFHAPGSVLEHDGFGISNIYYLALDDAARTAKGNNDVWPAPFAISNRLRAGVELACDDSLRQDGIRTSSR